MSVVVRNIHRTDLKIVDALALTIGGSAVSHGIDAGAVDTSIRLR